MKVVNSISKLYNDQYALIEQLQKAVDKTIESIKSNKWHYDSRIKSLESFALKLETGRYSDPSQLEDFFACMLVVENANEIKNAITKLKPHIKILYRRPANDKFTHKNSDSFVFDDLRLYVTLKPTAARLRGPINEVKFEIQIKTFLQHAWAIATHDLIYKSDDINWTKQRVAYQVKAMLENAEVSIQKASTLKKMSGLPVSNEKVFKQNEIKKFILTYWNKERLPQDLIRLIDNINQLLKILNIDLNVLEGCLLEETNQGRGKNVLNLSPYLIIVQSLINQQPSKISNYLKKDSKYKILIPKEVDVTKIATDVNGKNAIRI